MLGAVEYRAFYAELSDLPEGEQILKSCCEAVRGYAGEIYRIQNLPGGQLNENNKEL
jgi:hypothetical protein